MDIKKYFDDNNTTPHKLAIVLADSPREIESIRQRMIKVIKKTSIDELKVSDLTMISEGLGVPMKKMLIDLGVI